MARWDSDRLVLDDGALFQGHYPGNPILPGSFLVEALFQAAAAKLGGDWRLAEIVSCRFKAPLRPGDVIQASFALSDVDAGLTRVEAKAGDAGEVTLLLATASAPLSPRAEVPAASAPLSPRAEVPAASAPLSPRAEVPAASAPLSPRAEVPAAARTDAAGEQAVAPTRELDPDFIRRTLPHRFPMLLVDRAVVLGAETSRPTLVAYKAVTLNEPCYANKAEPADWGYPASLVAESFCQACGLLRAGSAPTGQVRDPSRVPVIARLAKLHFVGEVRPGEVLEHRVRMSARTADGAVFTGESVAGGRTVLRVERVVAAMASFDSSAGSAAPSQ